jgi:hypothetical protein
MGRIYGKFTRVVGRVRKDERKSDWRLGGGLPGT